MGLYISGTIKFYLCHQRPLPKNLLLIEVHCGEVFLRGAQLNDILYT